MSEWNAMEEHKAIQILYRQDSEKKNIYIFDVRSNPNIQWRQQMGDKNKKKDTNLIINIDSRESSPISLSI